MVSSPSPVPNNGPVEFHHEEETQGSNASQHPPPPVRRDPTNPSTPRLYPDAGAAARVRATPIANPRSANSPLSPQGHPGVQGSSAISQEIQGADDDDEESASESGASFHTAPSSPVLSPSTPTAPHVPSTLPNGLPPLQTGTNTPSISQENTGSDTESVASFQTAVSHNSENEAVVSSPTQSEHEEAVTATGSGTPPPATPTNAQVTSGHTPPPGGNPDPNQGNAVASVTQPPQHRPPTPPAPPTPPGPAGPQPGAAAFGPPPAIPQRFSAKEPIPTTASVTAYGSSGVIREAVQSNDGLNHLPSPLNLSTHGAQEAATSSFSGTMGTDIFAGIDTFLTVQSALADHKNRKAAAEFTSDPANIHEYTIRKNILNSYKEAESNLDMSGPAHKLSADDVKFVHEFEELQQVAKGNKPMKQMTRFRDLGVQPTAAVYNTSVSIAHMATSAAPAALGFATAGMGMITGPINVIAGSVETRDAYKDVKTAKSILQNAPQITGAGKMETLIRDQLSQRATDKIKKAQEDKLHGISRAFNGTTGTAAAAVSVAGIATGAATMGIGAAIAAGVVGGGFAMTYTRKLVRGKKLEKSDLREQDVAQSFIDRNKGAANRNAHSAPAFREVKNAFSQTQNNQVTDIQVPSRKWHGKLKKVDKDGNTRMSTKPITGAHISNNRYINEYVTAGHIAKFLEGNPEPLRPMYPTNSPDASSGEEAMLGRKYIDDLKKLVPEAKVDDLISRARATSSFEERMAVLTKGLHDLSNI